MIWYVVTREFLGTVVDFFGAYGDAFAARPRVVFYDELARARRLPGGTYVFTDFERLSPAAAERAAQVWRDLSGAGQGVRLLNHPTRSLRRFELLRALHDDGTNTFDVYRLADRRVPARFPVFIRRDEHGGEVSPLLATPAALEAATEDLERRGVARDDKLVVEFCNTADAEGVFRKYSAFVVGERVVPAHIFFSRHWLSKRLSANQHTPAMLGEERCYFRDNPHADRLAALARRARVEFGRIDYGVHDGLLQVWEVNTNPQLPVPLRSHAVTPQQVPQLHATMQDLAAALAALEVPMGGQRVAIAPEKAALTVWAKRGVGVLPRRYRPAAKRVLWRLRRTGSVWRRIT